MAVNKPKPVIDKVSAKLEDLKKNKGSENKEVKEQAKEKRFRIIIDEQAGPDATSEVFVGVNGKHYLIKRGHEVIVPEGVVNVLREAVVTKIIKHEDGVEELKRIPRVAFRILGEVKTD